MDETLFSNHTVGDLMRLITDEVVSGLAQLDPETLALDTDSLVEQLKNRGLLSTPTLRESEITTSVQEQYTTSTQANLPVLSERPIQQIARVKLIVFHVPYDGLYVAFRCIPSKFMAAPPQADIRCDELRLTYPSSTAAMESIKVQFAQALTSIKQNLERLAADVDTENARFVDALRVAIDERKAALARQTESECQHPM